MRLRYLVGLCACLFLLSGWCFGEGLRDAAFIPEDECRQILFARSSGDLCLQVSVAIEGYG